jgi:hypothetical protein
MLNWELLREPYNWATVIIMALFALVLLSVVSPEQSI